MSAKDVVLEIKLTKVMSISIFIYHIGWCTVDSQNSVGKPFTASKATYTHTQVNQVSVIFSLTEYLFNMSEQKSSSLRQMKQLPNDFFCRYYGVGGTSEMACVKTKVISSQVL